MADQQASLKGAKYDREEHQDRNGDYEAPKRGCSWPAGRCGCLYCLRRSGDFMTEYTQVTWTIDRIVEEADRKTAEFLNACHACRPGHPWFGKDGNPFASLAFMAHGRIRSDGIDWLRRQAKAYDSGEILP
jgi:hypothetical protein